MAGIFTSNLLAQLQLSLVKDYQQFLSEHKTYEEICSLLRSKLDYNLYYNQDSSLYSLEPSEKLKAYTVLNTFLAACPQYLEHEGYRPPLVYRPIIEIRLVEDYRRHSHYCYCPTNDFIFYWFMLDALSYHHHHGPFVDVGGIGGHHHGHPNSGFSGGGGNDEKKAQLWAVLAIIALALIGIVLTTVALIFLFRAFADSMERLWHNEGIRQALVSMLSMAAFGAASGVLTFFFLTAPLTTLALAAGITNPVGLIVLSIICLSLIGAFAGNLLINAFQNYIIKIANPDALDPADPHRYTLDEEELREANLDPIKVNCAIATLRQQLGKQSVPNWFSRSREKQEILNTIRQLRRGELSEVDIEIDKQTFRFNLRPFPQPVVYVHQHPSMMPSAPSDGFGIIPPPVYGHPSERVPSTGYPQYPTFYAQPEQYTSPVQFPTPMASGYPPVQPGYPGVQPPYTPVEDPYAHHGYTHPNPMGQQF